MESAVRLADSIAREMRAGWDPQADPATVLMSPAAASFDMFVDYAARGRAFKAAVERIGSERKGGGDR